MKSLIVITGPTAVGKTAHAIEVARHFNTVILSADSRQCFKEMNIGVARPSAVELEQVPHFFIASHHIQDAINAAWYENYALALLQQLFLKHETIVVTGGTGLYIKALTHGLDAIPPVPASMRSKISAQYEQNGLPWLQQQLKLHDPDFFQKGEMQNPQRMMRALEVVLATGKSVLSYRNHPKKERPFQTIPIGLELPRAILYERINKRVDLMMQEGLEEEAKRLLPFRHLNALQTVGYKELFDHFDIKISINEAIGQIKQNTRRYAKRQLTWFKGVEDMQWINVEGKTNILPELLQLLPKTLQG